MTMPCAALEHVVRTLAQHGRPAHAARSPCLAPCKARILEHLQRRCLNAAGVAERTGMSLRAVEQAIYEMRVAGLAHVAYRAIRVHEVVGPGRRRHVVNYYRASV